METGPQLKVSSDRLVKPGIEPATPGLQGKQFIHYTTAASISWISEWIMILANLNLNHHIQHRCLPQSFSLTLLTIFLSTFINSMNVFDCNLSRCGYGIDDVALTPQAKFQFNLTYGLEDVV